jgi:formylglycine-generating enzyme required for sulfatase activity
MPDSNELPIIEEPSSSFDTVTLNSNGSITGRRKGKARVFTEDLGGGVTIEMVEIPGGTFLMGSPASEANRDGNEGPQHEVTVSAFYMSRYEVTQEQWRAVAGLPKDQTDMNPDPSYFKGDDHPVERVSWWEAMEFCTRLSRKTGKTYRLPTEAEWEYACRAGTTTPFAFGETITPEIVNYDGNYPYASAPKGVYRQKTTPVGSMGVANGFGLYDMHGNVWEWCMDWFAEDYYRQGPSVDPTGPATGSFRVERGGGWSYDARVCRSAIRSRGTPSGRFDGLGFRLLRTLR